MSIYFDHSATTPMDSKVLEAMQPYWQEHFGNASSIHSYGGQAAVAVDMARAKIAEILQVKPTEIIFTSGATEANNLAIKGLVNGLKLRGIICPHIITSAVEHDAVLEPLNLLEAEKQITLTILPVNKQGIVSAEDLRQAIKPETVLVSVMYVNSEVGSVQPITELSTVVKQANNEKLANWSHLSVSERGDKPQLIYFHSDATQAPNYFDCGLENLGVDMLSLSAHKMYGPKGSGLLAVKGNVPLVALLHGGHHERNWRSGTLNVPGIVGLGEALALATLNREKNAVKVAEVRDYLVKRIVEEMSKVVLNTPLENNSPSHAHFSFLGAEGESILMALDLEAGIAVSTGSACASNTLGASKVLLAMGIKVEDTHGAIRFTLGKHNTREDIDELMKHLPGVVKKFRDMAPDLTPYQGKGVTAHH
ncbi:cysteine desulfurase NifS [Candidatus Falkowbacteria bacterium CG10_big_fil_rev_8_21_14_0_10_37_14]|uniref:cysteine desulfurase n=1 Tax=Candidatus Falkowbacteria bacterium CG10_big_fil_rev_8_21_14_0_10_37_14 TaxID=1974561 RepID=A0A2M6WSK7_9BACT|nr:cysteine desulfurase [Candidatus Falkowbacteria bacterium]PIT95778.1 MAG: cysteine desulfurase NifS [Candidatus Falkowbacteria bacterium CG10_big_fil_rev_8_21_14_0_10_37_14]